MRVLVLDDNEVFCSSVARSLRMLWPEVEVTSVSSSNEAHRRVAERQYHLMLIDLLLAMGDEDRTGARFLRRVRGDGFRIPAVLISGAEQAALERNAREAGAEAWARKSDDWASLRKAIEKALGAYRNEGASTLLPPELGALVQEVRALAMVREVSRATHDARSAHGLARLALKALATEGCDDSLVRRCAHSVGLQRNSLSAYAPLGRWSLERLEAFLSRRNAKNEYLTVSHALLIATLPEPALTAMEERLVAESLSVKSLQIV